MFNIINNTCIRDVNFHFSNTSSKTFSKIVTRESDSASSRQVYNAISTTSSCNDRGQTLSSVLIQVYSCNRLDELSWQTLSFTSDTLSFLQTSKFLRCRSGSCTNEKVSSAKRFCRPSVEEAVPQLLSYRGFDEKEAQLADSANTHTHFETAQSRLTPRDEYGCGDILRVSFHATTSDREGRKSDCSLDCLSLNLPRRHGGTSTINAKRYYRDQPQRTSSGCDAARRSDLAAVCIQVCLRGPLCVVTWEISIIRE